MPRFDFECGKCQTTRERLLSVAASSDEQFCDSCGHPLTKVFLKAPAGYVSDYKPYKCPITDKVISGKKAHEENLKLHGSRLLEPGEHADNAKRREAENEALDKEIETTVEKEILEMPSEKRELLAKELSTGVDAQVVRH